MDVENKTVVFLGSSVTYGDNGWSMCEYVAEQSGCNVLKWAVSGTTLADCGAESYVQRLQRALPHQLECDLFICQLSTNDAMQNLPLGQISPSQNKAEFDVGTILGALEWIIASAQKAWQCPVSVYTGTYFDSPLYQRMVEALPALCEKWGIAVLDLWNDPQMRAVPQAEYACYMLDPIHPSAAGYRRWWGPKFTAHIEQQLAERE